MSDTSIATSAPKTSFNQPSSSLIRSDFDIQVSLADTERWLTNWLVVVARHEVAALSREEIEVRAFVRLQHVIEIQAPVAARERRLGLFPFPAPLRELIVRYEQLQPALRDVELDFVAVLDERERAARRGLGRDVQHHRSVRRAAHARVRDANHVGDAALQEFRRERHI